MPGERQSRPPQPGPYRPGNLNSGSPGPDSRSGGRWEEPPPATREPSDRRPWPGEGPAAAPRGGPDLRSADGRRMPGPGPDPRDPRRSGGHRMPGTGPDPRGTGGHRMPGTGPDPRGTGGHRMPGTGPDPRGTGAHRMPGPGPDPRDRRHTAVLDAAALAHEPAKTEGREPGRRARRRAKRAARRTVIGRHPLLTGFCAVLVLLTPVWISLGNALTDPGLGSSMGARGAEWFRDHGGSSIVNWAENLWYSHHQPPVGGTPANSAIPSLRSSG
jgi:hypothetical protein